MASPALETLGEATSSPASIERVAAGPTTTQPSTDYVSGVVLNPAGDPLTGAACSLTPIPPPDGFRYRAQIGSTTSPPISSTVSASNGEFQLRAPAGFWQLEVRAAGFATWKDGPVQAKDFRWVRLDSAKTLAVQVWTEGGEPIPNATIQLVKNQSDGFTQRVEKSLTTDAMGFALFDDFPSGKWFLRITHKKYAGALVEILPFSAQHLQVEARLLPGVEVYGNVFVGLGQTAPTDAYVFLNTGIIDGYSGAHKVRCEADGSYRSNFALHVGQTVEVTATALGYGEQTELASVKKEDVADGLRLDFQLDSAERVAVGRVINEAGEPIPGVEVYGEHLDSLPHETSMVVPSLNEMMASGFPDPSDLEPVSSHYAQPRLLATTSSDGRFRLSQLASSKGYELRFASVNYANRIVYQIDGVPGERVDLGDIVLRPAGKVFGKVIRDNGIPVTEAVIYTIGHFESTYNLVPGTVLDVPRKSSELRDLTTYTNQEGEFVFSSFPEALAPDAGFELYCEGTYFGTYHIKSGESLGPLELVVKEKGEGTIPVRLTVTDRQGKPITKALAQMIRAGKDDGPQARTSAFDWTFNLANSSGVIELRGDGVGSYEVRVMDLSGVYAETTFQLELEDGMTVENTVVLEDSPTSPQNLAGMVLSANGQPLAEMTVSVVPQTGSFSCSCFSLETTTDEQGNFNLGSFMEGNHRLTVSRKGEFQPLAHYFPARSGEMIVIYVE